MVAARERGFTLPEVLVVVAVLGILTAAGLPSMADFVRKQRLKTASFDLYSTLVYARSEAITRNNTVKVEPVSGDWTNGWTVKDASGTLLRELGAVSSVVVTVSPDYVEFRASGRLKAAGVRKFELSDGGTPVQNRCITVDLSGRPNTAQAACS